VRTSGDQTYNGAVTFGGATTLQTTAGGNISASGAVTATAGILTLDTGAGNAIFSNSSNDFGTVRVASGNKVSLTDVNAIQFGGASTVGGNLTLNVVGISEVAGASLAVTGTSAFNAGAGPIALANAGNDFTGAVSLNNSGANDVAVTDANAIVLGASNVGSGTLTVTATGANSITQTGAIVQAAGAGAASFTTGNGPIVLTQANDFTGPVSATDSGASAISITDVNALTLGTVN